MLTNKLTGAGAADKTYIEDVFSTYLYTGNGVSTFVESNIQVGNGLESIQIQTPSTITSSGFRPEKAVVRADGTIIIVGTSYDSVNSFSYGTYIRSTDGGSTWTNPSTFNGYTSASYFSSVTVSSSGRFVAVGYTLTGAIFYTPVFSTSTDGITWTSPTLFNGWTYATTQGAAMVGVAVNSSGRFVAVGYQKPDSTGGAQEGIWSTSTDGVTWTTPSLFNGAAYPNHIDPQDIAVNSSGRFVVIGTTGTVSGFSTSTDGVTWTSPATLTSETGTYAYKIGVSPSGRFVVLQAGSGNPNTIKFSTSTDGVNWSASADLAGYTQYGDVNNGSISVNSSGMFVAVCLDNNYLPIYTTSMDGINWSPFKKVTSGNVSGGSFFNTSGNFVYIAQSSPGASSLTTRAFSTTIPAVTGKGGMVWIKQRNAAVDHAIYDTTRGATYDLGSNLTTAQTTQSTGLTSFNNSGAIVGSLSKLNTSGSFYTSWSFRKAPKFFDVVTYTGNGSARTISHSLGSIPGMVIVKCTSTTGNWAVYHSSQTSASYYTKLNLTDAQSSDSTVWNGTSPTASVFSVGTSALTNTNGVTYVAYLFAHDTTTDGLIQCGSFTGPTAVNLGWEPQFLLTKRTDSTGNWELVDSVRSFTASGGNSVLFPNTSGAEITGSGGLKATTSTGFTPTFAGATETYIYMAIRRGPMKTPTEGTKVFSPVAYTGTNVDRRLVDTGIVTDMVMARQRTGAPILGFGVADRLRGDYFLGTAVTDAEAVDADSFMTTKSGYGNSFSEMNGFGVGNDAIRLLNGSSTSQLAYAFKRAPGFFDEVCYTGNGGTGTISHSLGVAPDMIIGRCRSAAGLDWLVYVKSLGANGFLRLNTTAANGGAGAWYADPTSTVFSPTGTSELNASGNTYVAYLFASCPGVSKVGSYTGNGTSQTINCSFTSGARFVLIKRTDSTGDWYVWDTARGIVTSTDPHLSLNTAAAEVTTDDTIDPTSTGFIVNQVTATNVNVSGASYIYLAIA